MVGADEVEPVEKGGVEKAEEPAAEVEKVVEEAEEPAEHTSVISSPSLPSPTTATLSSFLTSCCSTMRKAAASGSMNAAFSLDTWSGTTCRNCTGIVSRSW